MIPQTYRDSYGAGTQCLSTLKTPDDEALHCVRTRTLKSQTPKIQDMWYQPRCPKIYIHSCEFAVFFLSLSFFSLFFSLFRKLGGLGYSSFLCTVEKTASVVATLLLLLLPKKIVPHHHHHHDDCDASDNDAFEHERRRRRGFPRQHEHHPRNNNNNHDNEWRHWRPKIVGVLAFDHQSAGGGDRKIIVSIRLEGFEII